MLFITHSVRIIALSATLPNLIDIGEWLGCRQQVSSYLLHFLITSVLCSIIFCVTIKQLINLFNYHLVLVL